MKSPFAQYSGGGIEPNQNIAATGQFLGKLAADSFSAVGEELAEGLKAYQKNAAEDEYLKESISVKAGELQKWASIVGSDPKYAPLLEGIMPMMDKASKGPSMSLTQKRALDSNLGAYLKALPSDFELVDRISTNAEKAAAEDAEAEGLAASLSTTLPMLSINPIRAGLAAEGSKILMALKGAKSREEKRRAVQMGKQFFSMLAPNMAIQDKEYAAAAQIIAQSPDVVEMANEPTPAGKVEKSVGGGISLIDADGNPMSPTALLAEFDRQIQEAVDANPEYQVNPEARIKFLEGVMDSLRKAKMPEETRKQWLEFTFDKIMEVQIGLERQGFGMGDFAPEPPMIDVPSSEGLTQAKEREAGLAKREAAFQKGDGNLYTSPVAGTLQAIGKEGEQSGQFSSQLAELRSLSGLRANSAVGIVGKIIEDYYSTAENPNERDMYVFLHRTLKEAGLVESRGVLLKGAKGQQGEYESARAAAEAWFVKQGGASGKTPIEEANDPNMDWENFGFGALGYAATAVAKRYGSKYGSVDWGVGNFGTRAYLRKRQANLKANAAAERATSLKDLVDAAERRYQDAQTAVKNRVKELVQRGHSPDVARGLAKKEIEEARKAKGLRTEDAVLERERKAIFDETKTGVRYRIDMDELRDKHKLYHSDGRRVTYDEFNDPKFRARNPQIDFNAAEKDMGRVLERTLSRTRAKGFEPTAAKNWKSTLGRNLLEQAIYLGTGFATSSLAGEEAPVSKTVEAYDTVFGTNSDITKRIEFLQAQQTGLQSERKAVDAELKVERAKVQAETRKSQVVIPFTSGVSDALSADAYQAASREEVLQRTTQAINERLGVNFSEARAIAEKLNPPSASAQVANIGGTRFLVHRNEKGVTEYKELSKTDEADAGKDYAGTIVAAPALDKDGKPIPNQYTRQFKPRVLTNLAYGGKWPADYTPMKRTQVNDLFISGNNFLTATDKLLKGLEEGGVRLLNRDAAALVNTLQTILSYEFTKIYGTPPISNIELGELKNAATRGEPNAVLTLDSSTITALKATREFLVSTMQSQADAMDWKGAGSSGVFVIKGFEEGGDEDPIVELRHQANVDRFGGNR